MFASSKGLVLRPRTVGEVILAEPKERLYIMTQDQAVSWGPAVNQHNISEGFKSRFLLVEPDSRERFLSPDENFSLKNFRHSFAERAVARLSFTSEVQHCPITQDFLELADMYKVPTFPIRSLAEAEAALAEMRSVYG